MFQKFTSSANREAGPERLEALRGAMEAEGVSAFLIPHADEHQNEYQPRRAQRLSWLTGFTGSAGFAIATLKTCAVFVDGRYTLQVEEQIHPDAFVAESLVDLPPSKWLEKNTTADDVVAYDPWLVTVRQKEAYAKACEKSGATLKPVDNLIDRIWEDQPPAPHAPVFLHPIKFTGQQAAEKIRKIRKKIEEKDCDLTVLTDPASLAWLFNMRGSDVVHNPLALGFAIVPVEGKPLLFLDDRKLDETVRGELLELAELHAPATLIDQLTKMSREKSVLCDPNLMASVLVETIETAGGKIVEGRDPVVLPRAIKNDVEVAGSRAAHIRDGVAMCKFLCWLDNQDVSEVTEISAAKKLEQCRRDNAIAMGSRLEEISFDTISGHGPNGAIVHYRVTEETDRRFETDTLYLCDSGAQYLDGTTDITRTIAIGTPPAEAVTDFTLVLKGHIAIARARFPKGTRGVDIDSLARKSLWEHGKDFAHGTGHGIGSYLNVHEGPQSISRRGMEPLVPGMIISNEPGYYVEGQYGIRIENLVVVEEAKTIDGGNIETMGFETVTLTPIDTRLVDGSLLSEEERNWLNEYHDRVCEILCEHLEPDEADWLKKATAHI